MGSRSLHWNPNGTATLCTLIDTKLCKHDYGKARPKHVADITSCRLQLSIVLCKEGLIKKKSYFIDSQMYIWADRSSRCIDRAF